MPSSVYIHPLRDIRSGRIYPTVHTMPTEVLRWNITELVAWGNGIERPVIEVDYLLDCYNLWHSELHYRDLLNARCNFTKNPGL